MLPLKYGPYKGAYVPSRGLRQLVVRGCRSLTGWVDFSLPHAAILALLSLPTKILVGRLCYVIFEKSQRCASCNEINPKLIFFRESVKTLDFEFYRFYPRPDLWLGLDLAHDWQGRQVHLHCHWRVYCWRCLQNKQYMEGHRRPTGSRYLQ